MTLSPPANLATRADKLYEEAENLEFVISELEDR